ncbi:unnamed protein product, partial [Polarella glacialis]
ASSLMESAPSHAQGRASSAKEETAGKGSLKGKGAHKVKGHGKGVWRGTHARKNMSSFERQVISKEEAALREGEALSAKMQKLELADEAFGGCPVYFDEANSLWWFDSVGKKKPLESHDASEYLKGIMCHLLSGILIKPIAELSLRNLSRRPEEGPDHVEYHLFKTPFNRIEWHVDLLDSRHIRVKEVEELAVASDTMWFSRVNEHELEKPAAVMETIRKLVSIALTVSDDPEDEYLSELWEEDAAYIEQHGCPPHDY